jgi:thiamine-monophosphate kinase
VRIVIRDALTPWGLPPDANKAYPAVQPIGWAEDFGVTQSHLLRSRMYAPARMKKAIQQRGELALIEYIQQKFASRPGRSLRLGIGDDCAILSPTQGTEVLVTTDFTLEGRHFRRDWHSPESVGHRCLARGLSDLAAMGATPTAAFLSLALPSGLSRSWTERFFHGLQALADRYSVPLAGGDTAEAPGEAILADIILIGSAPAGRALRRTGARAGDLLYVTGALGGAAAELDRMRAGKVRLMKSGSWERHPQMFPEPRIALGERLLAKGWASGCMDLSDGLSTDLAHLCRASGVSAEVDAAALPMHPLAAKLGAAAALQAALHGGEDYELLFAAPKAAKVPAQIAGVAVTAIGRITRKVRVAGVTLLDPDGSRSVLQPGGWEHLRG